MDKILVDRELLQKAEAVLTQESALLSEQRSEITDAFRALLVNPQQPNDAVQRLNLAMPYLRNAVSEANTTGSAQLAVISINPDGSGRVVCKFECNEFMTDLAGVIGAGEQTAEDEAQAEALKFLQRNNIKVD